MVQCLVDIAGGHVNLPALALVVRVHHLVGVHHHLALLLGHLPARRAHDGSPLPRAARVPLARAALAAAEIQAALASAAFLAAGAFGLSLAAPLVEAIKVVARLAVSAKELAAAGVAPTSCQRRTYSPLQYNVGCRVRERPTYKGASITQQRPCAAASHWVCASERLQAAPLTNMRSFAETETSKRAKANM